MTPQPPTTQEEARIFAITRPDANLLVQFFLWSVASVVFFPVVFVPLFFRYHTMRYRFDSEGISMSWGLLFRREVNLTYSRIQDIHLSRGIIERWLGIATVAIQTASGSSGPEMSIQGLKEYDLLRDFLYSRMRGHRAGFAAAPVAGPAAAPAGAGTSPIPGDTAEALQLLRQIHGDLAEIRRALPSTQGQLPPRADSRET